MAMVIPQFCILFLAVLSLNQLFFKETDWENAWKKTRTSIYAIGGVFILLLGFYLMSDYSGKSDEEHASLRPVSLGFVARELFGQGHHAGGA